ncbi:hypothetical protein [Rhodoplanes roseus]|uniref:hypothetical protein n=1 Tax=Rhodoplanes roseus TaxID=29409 RepID=UPI001475424F|nr:hypothetical protein [Rhodoplanes roseus]
MTRIVFALATLALVSATGAATAAPFGDRGSHYVASGSAVVETGIDRAKGNID